MRQKARSDTQIKPELITKPIQLLATWFASLILIDGSFFVAAKLASDPWISDVLYIAAVANVYLFVFCLYRLQTKFRTEIQEDSYYSKFLGKKQEIVPTTSDVQKQIAESQSYTVEILQQVQSQITSFSEMLPLLAANAKSVDPGLQEIETRFAREIAVAENSLKAAEQWAPYLVQVNDLLPRYGEIHEALKRATVPIGPPFGTTSVEARVPTIFLLTFGPGIAVTAMQAMIRLLQPYGVNAVDVSLEDIHQRFIYIGSYGYEYNYVAPLGQELLERLTQPGISSGSFLQAILDDCKAKYVESFKQVGT